MKFDYFEMLSGHPIEVEHIGHIRSPLLRELSPSGIGMFKYNLYLNFLSWNREALVKYARLLHIRGIDKIADNELLTTFDIITLLAPTRELCREVLAFFIIESPIWNEKKRCFETVVAGESDSEESIQVIGNINRDNFEEVREDILQFNYIGLNKDASPIQHSSEHSKELWERAQQYLKEQSQKQSSEDKPEYHLSNIVSKLCVAHPSYNLLNVFDLTVFQLYDQFFQYGYMRSADLNERIFSNHGGDKFHMEDWLKPILKNV